MKKKTIWSASLMGLVAMAALLFGLSAVAASGNEPGEKCEYGLSPAGSGTATLKIENDEIKITIEGGRPDTLYMVWVDFRNRANNKALAADHPGTATAQAVAPAFATTAGVTSGMGIDPNGLVTDDEGDASLTMKLDFNLLAAGASPLVVADLVVQGANRIVG